MGSCLLDIPHLPQPLLSHVFSDSVLNTSLLSIVQLYQVGCVATFTATAVTITYDALTVLSGAPSSNSQLWIIQTPHLAFPSAMVNAAVALSTDAAFIKYAHAALGSPSLSTLTKAVQRGYFHLYPRLTASILSANLPTSMATAQGHLDQHRQGQDSTQVPVIFFDESDEDTSSSSPDSSPTPSNHPSSAYTRIVLISDTLHSDLTGRFPVTSHNGSQYIFVSVLDGYIHVEPMKTRHHTDYVAAYKKTIDFFARLGRQPTYQRLDNETSGPLEAFAIANNIKIQYCPPHTHRSLKAERAIRTLKNHFIATLCTADPAFPLMFWDELLPQVEICLNRLIPYSPNTSVSAYAGLHGGAFNFAQHPIAPAGTRVLIHDKPTVRSSWAPHGVPGYYLGPALQHYRSYRVWSSATKATRVTDTVAWFPSGLTVPGPSTHDILLHAVDGLKAALKEFSRTPSHLRHAPQPPTTVIDAVIHGLHSLIDSSALPSSSVISNLIPQDSLSASSDISHLTSNQRVSSASIEPITANEISPIPPSTHLPLIPQPPVLHAPVDQYTPLSVNTPDTRITSCSTQPSIPLPPLLIQPQTRPPHFAAVTSALNLDEHGRPLRYTTAKSGQNSLLWERAETEELDRLLTTATIRPLLLANQPLERRRDTTYYNPQTKEKEDKAGERTYRIRGTIGGDKINSPGPTTARTAAMPLVKLLLHSVISENSKWLTIDIKDYYLNTPLPRPEYLRISTKFLPSDIVIKYDLNKYVHNKSVLFEVTKGMYGLPQAGLLAQQRLIAHLAKHGYHQTNTDCLFRHVSNGTDFSLDVDDFGVKYTNKSGVDHLIQTLQALYSITINWTGSKYLGFTIEFDYPRRTVTLSMPGYIAKALQRFAPSLQTGANSPAIYVPPNYGIGQQTPSIDTSTPLSLAETTTLQEIVGSLLYYARAIDVTILPAVTHLSSLQANPTQDVLQSSQRLLAYCSRYPNNALRYHACDMTLHIQSDASYLSRPQARSVAGAIFYLGNAHQPTHINGCVHALSSIIPSVVASVAEAEYAALFQAGQEGSWLRNILSSLGYPQPPTVILCDNKCAVGIALDTIKPKRTKSIDMRYHWIRDRVRQGQYVVTWRQGTDNLADFFTKPLPVHVHQSLMPLLVHIPPATATACLTKSADRAAKWSAKKLVCH